MVDVDQLQRRAGRAKGSTRRVMNKRVFGERDESPGAQGSSLRPETSLTTS